MSKPGDTPPALWAVWLGYAGLIPFVALAIAPQFLPPVWQAFCVSALVAYGATITSFLGAIHWGLAMRDTQNAAAAPYAWGVAPSLTAWVALLVNPVAGLFILSFLLWVCYAVDRSAYPRYQLQSWLTMRLQLTVVASSSCLYVAASMAF